jgi:lysophospholipase L1-like esterase
MTAETPESKNTPDRVPLPKRSRRSAARDLLFAAAACVLFLLLIEGALRIVGFRYEAKPILIDTTWGKNALDAMNRSVNNDLFQRDPLLFYSMKPGAKTADGRVINELGLVGDPVAIPKPPQTFRILCLGDSCTAEGPPSYPKVLDTLLDEAETPERRFDVVNGGVYSYTSLQGLRFFQHRLEGLAPDLVTVYYGWNDHYLTMGYPDKVLKSTEEAPPFAVRLLRWFRIYQFIQKSIAQARQRKRDGQGVPRVAPQDFRRNISDIVDLARKRGARALLITAPTTHIPDTVPPEFLKNKQALSGEDMVDRHMNYAQIVREVAGEKDAALLDLVRVLDDRDKDPLFVGDGVHFTPRGRRLVGRLLFEKLVDLEILGEDALAKGIGEQTYASDQPNRVDNRIEFLDSPLRVVAGKPIVIHIRIANTGDTRWLAETANITGTVRLGASIRTADGQVVLDRDAAARGSLPGNVAPGESIEMQWVIKAVDKPGRYVLEVDPVAEFVGWFNDLDDDAVSTTALIVEAPSENSAP